MTCLLWYLVLGPGIPLLISCYGSCAVLGIKTAGTIQELLDGRG